MTLNGVRVAGVLRLTGAQQRESSPAAAAGEVVALARMEGIAHRHRAGDSGTRARAAAAGRCRTPVFGLAIAAEKRNDDVKLTRRRRAS